jgi:glycopeptide antibiotics resistance protein
MLKLINKIKKLSRRELVIKGLCLLAMLIYVYCVLSITLIDRTAGMRRHVLRPMWELSSMLQSGDYSYWSGQIGGNLIMLLPLGFLLPIISDRFGNIKAAAAAGFMFSLFIEFSQYYTGRGLFEVDDIIHNTMGACIGCIIYAFMIERLIGRESDME